LYAITFYPYWYLFTCEFIFLLLSTNCAGFGLHILCETGEQGTLVTEVFAMCNGPTNALVCNKTLIQMSHIKTLKITPTCFDHQLIIIRELI
jgi:hypothetical protein